ncbi:ATP-binding cassette domain-containing protein [Phenylobacterium sp.]|uniref:ATP-binding cassette domain-containing protein n=1 Tax=Phenylobacterium sp. TaxID=1871053 RepID=UPI0035B172C6
MSAPSPIRAFLQGQTRRRRADLLIAGFAAALAAAGATLMLGLSGWFLAGAAAAGLGGALAVQGFNYLLPSAGLRGLAIARTAGRYGERLFSHRAAFHALAALRPALFHAIAATPPQRSLTLSGGESSAHLVQDVDAVETLFVRRSAAWAGWAGAGAAGGVIALASPLAAVVFLTGLATQVLVLRYLAGRLTAAPSAAQARQVGRLKNALGAYAPATAELRCFGLTGHALAAVAAHDQALSRAILARRDREALLDVIEAAATVLLLAAVAILSASASTPLRALAVLAAFAAIEAAAGVLRAARDQGGADAAIARLDAAIAAPSAPVAGHPADKTLRILGHDLSPGDRLALVGPSGCGKTSLVEMLLGLRPASPGALAAGGAPLENLPSGCLRSLLAWAPQDTRILTGTVEENLRLGAPEAPEATLWSALEDARLAGRVRNLPGGLQAWLGDGGEILSGGERRRLALARALLRPAPWLVLDEPTEGLDPATEAAVIEALAARLTRTGQGLILISHRPAPLRLATVTLAMAGEALSEPQ